MLEMSSIESIELAQEKIKETASNNNTGLGVAPNLGITSSYNNILVGVYKEQSFFSKIKYFMNKIFNFTKKLRRTKNEFN